MVTETLAFVAGATGYTGRAVVSQLCHRGAQVYAHIRPDSPQREHWTQTFTQLGAHVDVTPWQREALTATLVRCKINQVFVLIGTTKARAQAAARAGQAPADYDRVDVGLSLLLIAAAVAANTQPRVVYLSATGVRDRGGNAYMQARARVEAALRTSGLPFTIARPSFITGPDRDESRPLERIGAVVSDAVLAGIGLVGGRRLRDRYRSTTNAALATALIDLAADPEAAGRTVESEDLRPR